MGPSEHHRDVCAACRAKLVYLSGDPAVPYEQIDPSDGGVRTLVEHTTERCTFHQFLTSDYEPFTIPGREPRPTRARYQAWRRTDVE